jgi:hypothetical protein
MYINLLLFDSLDISLPNILFGYTFPKFERILQVPKFSWCQGLCFLQKQWP